MLDIICLHRLMKYLVYKQHSVTHVFSQTPVPNKVASFNFFIMYIELDHNLVPGKILDINKEKTLPTGKESKENEERQGMSTMNVNKYNIHQGDLVHAIKSQNALRLAQAEESKTSYERYSRNAEVPQEKQKDFSKFEAVASSKSENIYHDHDWGFFSAILACYNNHWVLRTSPDDWWNVIVRNVAQAIDKNGEKNKVRDFFVEHEGKKTIEVILPGRLDNIDYSWLFDQFSEGIRMNIKTPGYVDLMQADFSTTTPDQLISSQIMLMSSVQKYFDFGMSTMCGIPGVDMKGTLQDWKQLVTKTENLKSMLQPLMNELLLEDWFITTLRTLKNLVDTFEGKPDKEWWSHILSWNKRYGSGARSWWSGWMIDFLMAGKAESPQDFQSGMVSVPLEIKDPPVAVSDVGELVAGTFGYTVEEGQRAPVVEAKQGWVLFLPKGSPVIPRMKQNSA